MRVAAVGQTAIVQSLIAHRADVNATQSKLERRNHPELVALFAEELQALFVMGSGRRQVAFQANYGPKPPDGCSVHGQGQNDL
jgi:hypothetical protein